ncbi:MAG: 16S rRNA (guanine(527)-N(7))-methyltransferase RsmG [Xanthomonadales bacterium]|nr:16S rRNA (guanine(527)-N(7))-methyltransferase RsmG [Xanthomonadales bacterium]
MAAPARGVNQSDRDQLARGVAALSLELDAQAMDRMLVYMAELRRWNRRYNLVSGADMPALVTRHLLDSLAVLPWVGPGRLLDVGTGAGLPGLVLAIARPDLECTLLDSAGKKTRFLRHVVRATGLDNTRIVNSRAQAFHDSDGFATICSRAFSSLADFVGAVQHLAGPETRLLAMKGRRPDAELAALPEGVVIDTVASVTVPDLRAERHIVIMSIPKPAGG